MHGIHEDLIGFPATSQRHEYGDLILCQQGSGRCQSGFAGCQGALCIQCFKLTGLAVDIEGAGLPGDDGALLSRGRERSMTFQLVRVDIERRFDLAQCRQYRPVEAGSGNPGGRLGLRDASAGNAGVGWRPVDQRAQAVADVSRFPNLAKKPAELAERPSDTFG